MRKWIVLSCLLAVLTLLLSIGAALAGGMPRPNLNGQPALQVNKPIPDLDSLLAYPCQVGIEDLTGEERDQVVTALMATPDATQLKTALREKGFLLTPSDAEAKRVTVDGPDGTSIVEVAVVPATIVRQWLALPLIMKEYGTSSSGATGHFASAGQSGGISLVSPQGSVAYLTAMVADDGTSFFQAHYTNLDPTLAEVPDPPIIVNDTPYFYITTLQVVSGHIVYWSYWWYDSHHHPNWYYSLYRHYWDYRYRGGYPWPEWYHWVYGWYYWRFWYYWSAWFPWS